MTAGLLNYCAKHYIHYGEQCHLCCIERVGSQKLVNPPVLGAVKHDAGKVDASLTLEYFPRALKAIATVSDYGLRKYGVRGGWKDVANGYVRYGAAKVRHQLDQYIDPYDAESKMAHIAMEAWNTLARLEKALEAGMIEDRPGVLPEKSA